MQVAGCTRRFAISQELAGVINREQRPLQLDATALPNGPAYSFGLSFSAGGHSQVPWVAL
jgi:hypothetical protein